MNIFLILFGFFISISCKGKLHKKSKVQTKKKELEMRNIQNLDDKDNLRVDIENINILSIAYELTYDERSVLKVVLRALDDLEHDIKFFALLKSEGAKKSYKLSCENISINIIECYSEKNIKLDPNDKYYFHYKNNGELTLDEKEVLEDWKKVTLIFKPEMYEEQIMWKDHRKILGLNHYKMISGGYLYLVPKSKKLLHKTKDGFNQYIELNNFISHAGLMGQRPESSLSAYKEAIRRGFHIVDADLQFTEDKVPVILHSLSLEKVSDGEGKVSEKTLKELEKLDFGSKFSKKYAGEKILTFEKLLELCKENNVIIDLDLSHLNYKKYFEETKEYIKIIINTIEKYDMFDSIIFNDGPNPNTILKIKEIKNEISVSISNINKKENFEKIKEKYAGSKRIIFNFSGLSRGGEIDEKRVRLAASFGKVKAAVVDDLDFANDLLSWGVNFITTNKLHPFFINNEYEIPILIKCTQFDVLADCRLGPEVKIKDNEIYNIYYSTNIYNLYDNIVDEPIGEFKYLDTIKLDDLYYTVRIFDFENSYLKLNSSVKVDKGKKIIGKVGPSYENVADCYLYDFYCIGNNKYDIHCHILKNNTDIAKYDGNYWIHKVENYSLYIPQNETKVNSLFGINLDHNQGIYYIPIILFILMVLFIIIFSLKNRKSVYKLKEVNIADNSYIPETSELNK